jgi:hypothetical protein
LDTKKEAQEAFGEEFSSQVIGITESLSLLCRLNPVGVNNV